MMDESFIEIIHRSRVIQYAAGVMETILAGHDKEQKGSLLDEHKKDDVRNALSRLAQSLDAVIPLLRSAAFPHSHDGPTEDNLSRPVGIEDEIDASWLLERCREVQSDLDPEILAQSIVQIAQQTETGKDPALQQAALFDVLGASESAIALISHIIPYLTRIKRCISLQDIENAARNVVPDGEKEAEEQLRQLILQEAIEAAQVAALLQAELESSTNNTGGSSLTHTVLRTSDLQLQKQAKKAAQRAAKALQRAKDAGLALDDQDLLDVDRSSLGTGGLRNLSREEMAAMQRALLPEGSRKHYDKRGFPTGTIRTIDNDGTIRVVVPAARKQDAENIHPRINIADVLDSETARAFSGTASLNPMQSAVFQVAFHRRVNMLVCAPTGAGKTNVAMLTVVAHFRDVGLIGEKPEDGPMETGKKVVYIAPMKALAQEVVEKFSTKLKPLGIIVRELTGDMQLSRAEADSAHILVSTPEKWDVITRKAGTDDTSLGSQCGLLIIDEVHLLADERGAVIESVVSRVHRFVEARQRQVRIVALSATLPNYEDVAEFLQVPDEGLFFFGPEHRPVPLQQQFIGVNVKPNDRHAKEEKMNNICFDVVLDSLRRGYQVMVFVHSRKGTGETARALADLASEENVLEKYFVTKGKEGPLGVAHKRFLDRVKKSRSREVPVYFENGLGIHHAGMLRGDRKLSEQMFAEGAIRVLCCTATLAWGVNLPAHTIVIKGTDVYQPEKGGNVDLSVLDIQQIFGRAGRPQYDTSGEATMITTADAFPRYEQKLVRATPIESNFVKQLADHLNAEIVGGTVSNIHEASSWLNYTYLYVRMRRNPLAYGINADTKEQDPLLRGFCTRLVTDAAKSLDSNRMIRYSPITGNLAATETGRIASHFYLQSESIAVFNELFELKPSPTETDLMRLIASATEFKQMKVRQEELEELDKLHRSDYCPMKVIGAGGEDTGLSSITGSVDKVFVLIQALISRVQVRSFTLISDINYISSNAVRVARSLFEMCLKQNKPGAALKLLRIAKSIESQIWYFQSPLRHFEREISSRVLSALELNHSGSSSFDTLESTLALLDLQPNEINGLCRCKEGRRIQELIRMIPRLNLDVGAHPMTSDVLKVHANISSNFNWHGRWHGGSVLFWIWVESPNENKIYHQDQIVITKRSQSGKISLIFHLPTFAKSSGQYIVRTVSDSWVGVEQVTILPFKSNLSTSNQKIETDLQDLTPLPTTALQDSVYERLYTKFDAFNPIQTQMFHVLYHTDCPVLLGAPTGSGKSVVAEIAILRMKRLHPNGICVYIAPLKALARERLKDWKKRLGIPGLNWNVLELSGDTSHDRYALERADLLVCTPEKWDLISRSWMGTFKEGRTDHSESKDSFFQRVKLLVLDEVHLLGEERGAVLEAIVSRTRFISRYSQKDSQIDSTSKPRSTETTRIVGLSTALANAIDLADWIGIDTKSIGPTAMNGLYNFRHDVRPVPTEVHVRGFTGRHYCPRMATMNKPCLSSIKEYSPDKPVLIFVASRRQTRLTAFDIISYSEADEESKRFLHCPEDYIENIVATIEDESLRHCIGFGIGLHHAGLSRGDRDSVEHLFLTGKIQVLVATATLAWGVNLPAHLVIVKGTEYFDSKKGGYVDYPLTDVLQMIGRAGRPGFDTSAVAVVFCTMEKKDFYRKFLFSSFPVESCLEQRICENLNAEIVSGTITCLDEAVGYLTWTFFARRVAANPTYYGAKSSSNEDVEEFLWSFASKTLERLRESGCIRFDGTVVTASFLGRAASSYYLLHETPRQMLLGVREARRMIEQFDDEATNKMVDASTQTFCPLTGSMRLNEIAAAWLLYVVCSTHEFDDHPVRHNEEFLNRDLSEQVSWGADPSSLLSTVDSGVSVRHSHNIEVFQDPHTKCFLLIQAYLERVKLPISDFVNDTKGVIENLPRLLAALAFIAKNESIDSQTTCGLELQTQVLRTRQLVATRSFVNHNTLLQLPGVGIEMAQYLSRAEQIRKRRQGQTEGTINTLATLRMLSQKEASSLLQDAWRHSRTRRPKRRDEGTPNYSMSRSIQSMLDTLYSLPLIKVQSCDIKNRSSKEAVNDECHVSLVFEINREKPGKAFDNTVDNSNEDDQISKLQPVHSMTILLGTIRGRALLASEQLTVNARFGSWTQSKELIFEWRPGTPVERKNHDLLSLRIVYDDVRGLDWEMLMSVP